MALPKPKPPPKPEDVVSNILAGPEDLDAHLPTVELLGVKRWTKGTTKGWVAVAAKSQGMRLLSVEILGTGLPVPRAQAEDLFRVEAVKRGIIS